MSHGIIEYNHVGNPKCEICGKYFSRVMAHVRQKHFLNEREYKLQYGFDLIKGICSKASAERTRIKTLENYDLVIAKNLLNAGSGNRFKKGCKGRTRDEVSAQTKLMLIAKLKEPKMKEAMKKNGEALGKSGLGNKARWQ